MSRTMLFKQLAPQSWRRKLREYILMLKVAHIYGPPKVQLLPNEAAVTCVLKNGEFYLEQFIEHYFKMGFRHISFLDNGSTDRTISIAKRYKNVSIYTSQLPVESHQPLFKKYLAEKSAEDGWCLDVDIDEFFDYPSSNILGLRGFLEYLNLNSYTAVITQLLDLFSDNPVSHLTKRKEENLRSIYRYYDISEILKYEYHASEIVSRYANKNSTSNEETALIYGGIRKTLYRNNCLLTKHSLFRLGGRLELFPHAHFVNKARIADVSCVIHHYKLTSNALEVALQNRDKFLGTSVGYNDFVNFLMTRQDDYIKQKTAQEFRSCNELVAAKFLFSSDAFMEYVRHRGKV